MTIGERIKEARLRKGLTQAELAKLLGYKSRSSINKIEVEGRDIPRSSIVKFAEILDVSPAYLMGWEEREHRKAESRNRIESGGLNPQQMMDEAIVVFQALYARSFEAYHYSGKHVDFDTYVAMLLNQKQWKTKYDENVYNLLVDKFGVQEGIPAGTYYPYERYHDTLENISSPDFTVESAPTDFVRVPVIGSVAAGTQCLADMEIEEYIACDASMINSGYEYCYLKVKGDSMEPIIRENDLVLVRIQDSVPSGSYAVVLVDDENGLVKRVEYDAEQITLISENPYYPPRKFVKKEMNRIRIFGLVVETRRRFV